MERSEKDIRHELPEDKVFFAPLDEIRNIEQIIFNLERTRKELQKVAEGMKPIESS